MDTSISLKEAASISVIIDSQEASVSEKIIRRLRSGTELEVIIEPLPVGDFYFYDDDRSIVIERKAAGDFIKSIKDKRLLSQLSRLTSMKEECQKVLLVEGNIQKAVKQRHMSLLAVISSLRSVLVPWGVNLVILPTATYAHLWLVSLGKTFDPAKKHKIRRIRSVSRGMPIQFRVRGFLEGGVGPKSADSLLRHYGNLRSVIEAAPADMQSLGIRSDQIAQLQELLDYDYNGHE